MSPIEKRIECGCFGRLASREHEKPSRETPREEFTFSSSPTRRRKCPRGMAQ
jgi:hypothetical protein